MESDPGSLAIVTAVTGMSRSLGVPVTAEGVEDAATVAALRDIGCDKGQGWYFGKVLSAKETCRLLHAKGLLVPQAKAGLDPTMPEIDRAA